MIGNSENRISFNGNGSATEFSYQFKILNKTDIKVLLVDNKGKETLLSKDYYVDTEKSVVHYPGYAPGAEIPEAQRPPVLQNGWKLILYREVPVTQESRLDEYWPFNVIESMADKLTIICQQLLDGVSRSIKISEGSKSGIDTVIDVAPNKGLKWNAEGTKIVATVDPADVLPQANDVLKQTEAARDKAIQKADAAAESALSAADSERNADTAMNKARAWAEGHEPGGASTKSSKEWATEASTKATEATEQAQLAKWWAQGHMPENNPSNQSAKEWAKTSEIRANIATEKAELATQKATESLASANKAKESADAAKTSETAAKSSETAAKASETKAKASETNAGTSANKATTEANRAKTEADRAKTAADSVGNPVVSITQSGGNLTVTKGDGSSNTLTVTPAKASQAEATAGTDNTKMMTPLRVKEAIVNQTRDLPKLVGNNQFIGKNQFIGEINQGVVKKVEGDIPNLSNIGADVLALTLTSGNAITLDIAKIFGGVSGGVARVCIITLSGSLSATITWTHCKLCCDAPAKTSNKTTIVTFYVNSDGAYLVSACTEV